MKKLTLVFFAIMAMFVLTSFNFVSDSKKMNQKSKVSSVKKNKKAKKVAVKKTQPTENQEITETKIEISPEYQQMLADDSSMETMETSTYKQQPVAVAMNEKSMNKENPNKVHYFIRSKESPNLYETK